MSCAAGRCASSGARLLRVVTLPQYQSRSPSLHFISSAVNSSVGGTDSPSFSGLQIDEQLETLGLLQNSSLRSSVCSGVLPMDTLVRLLCSKSNLAGEGRNKARHQRPVHAVGLAFIARNQSLPMQEAATAQPTSMPTCGSKDDREALRGQAPRSAAGRSGRAGGPRWSSSRAAARARFL
jgi:hypothetical protein